MYSSEPKNFFKFLNLNKVILLRNTKDDWIGRILDSYANLCKPSTSSQVCITVSNSPNPSRVYTRLCKHGKRFLLRKCHMFWVHYDGTGPRSRNQYVTAWKNQVMLT